MFIKDVVKHFFASLYFLSGSYKRFHAGKLIILMYHRVLPKERIDPNWIQQGMFVERTIFINQLKFLSENYKIISFDEFIHLSKSGTWNPAQQYCILTFDDGWRDNYDYAFPIIKKFGIKATIFVTTGYIGTDRCFWPERLSKLFLQLDVSGQLLEAHNGILRAANKAGVSGEGIRTIVDFACRKKQARYFDRFIEALKVYPNDKLFTFVEEAEKFFNVDEPHGREVLQWSEISEMEKYGVSICSHGVSHRILTGLDKADIWQELTASKSHIEQYCRETGPIFCYPNGNYNDSIKKMVAKAGYRLGVTTKFGSTDFELNNSFEIPRLAIHSAVSNNNAMFAFYLTGIWKKLKRIFT
jgi:peptidoglycan/xylan/chitin deacetylase (PgdA/CDA1 family)